MTSYAATQLAVNADGTREEGTPPDFCMLHEEREIA